MLPGGEVVPLTPAYRHALKEKMHELAVRPLRCLAFALKEGEELGELAHFKQVGDRAVLYVGPGNLGAGDWTLCAVTCALSHRHVRALPLSRRMCLYTCLHARRAMTPPPTRACVTTTTLLTLRATSPLWDWLASRYTVCVWLALSHHCSAVCTPLLPALPGHNLTGNNAVRHDACTHNHQDPARPEVATAMLSCQGAGVRVIVMTGDSKETAVAIARDVNIFGRVSRRRRRRCWRGHAVV